MISVSVLIVDIDFLGGKCNLKIDIRGEKCIKGNLFMFRCESATSLE